MPVHLTTGLVARFWTKVSVPDDPTACFLWQGHRNNQGYGMMWGGPENNRQPVLAHRVAWAIAHGPDDDDRLVLHNCPGGDNRVCVNSAHLFRGTARDNTLDMIAKGRARLNENHPYGVSHPHAKLDDDTIRAIRADYIPRKVGYRVLARRYGVARSLIAAIVRREIWRHVD